MDLNAADLFKIRFHEYLTKKTGPDETVFNKILRCYLPMLFYSISGIGASKADVKEDFYKGAGGVFSILIGLGNLVFAFFFKDLLVAIINLLIYIEMAKYFYLVKEYIPNKADGALDIIMVLISGGVIFYLFFKERENLYRS